MDHPIRPAGPKGTPPQLSHVGRDGGEILSIEERGQNDLCMLSLSANVSIRAEVYQVNICTCASCMYTCVCMCTCVYVCAYVCMYVCMYVCAYMYTNNLCVLSLLANVNIRAEIHQVDLCVCARMDLCAHVWMCAWMCMRTCMQVCMYTCACACACACICDYACACVCDYTCDDAGAGVGA